jgi:predicted NBD/HSP70 family sugar kinase
LAKAYSWPIYYTNDITAACAAELLFGCGGRLVDYLYLFVGSFIGGGLVLNGHLFTGRTENAAAIGSMPAYGGAGVLGIHSQQLMNVASIYTLERTLIAEGRPAEMLWRTPDVWGELGPALDSWIVEAAQQLAYAIVAAVAVVDTPTIIVDGGFPKSVRARLVTETRLALENVNRQGLSPFEVIEGTIGHAARALGGATIPLMANFSQDSEVLFKKDQSNLPPPR